MKKTRYQAVLLLIALTMLLSGCKKEDDFLAAKPDQQLYVLNTLTDAANMMHDEHTFNNEDPALGEIASDDFYVTGNLYNGLYTTLEKKGYIWAKDVYDPGQNVRDWSQPYTQVYYANTVLDALPNISVPPGQQGLADEVKGDALFFRAKAFYELLETFCLPYRASTAAQDPGIPLRLTSDINNKSVRASLKDSYAQVSSDLLQAAGLLPSRPAFKTQPSKPAAYGYLARVYLAMSEFSQALGASNEALQLNSDLTDYNTLTPSDYNLSNTYLDEDIFHSTMNSYSLITINSVSLTDTMLYRSYAANDLRKQVLFVTHDGSAYFRGTYDFEGAPYSGIANDELYLVRAECEARLGDVSAAMKDLNTLLAKRWLKGTFVPYNAASADEGLSQVLLERRKELIDRGLRWTDLRRLNQEPAHATNLVRKLNGVTYTLPAGDLRYALPIPDNEIQNSGLQQNQR